MEKLVFATNNLNKIQEIKLLINTKTQILSLQDIGWGKNIKETGKSFKENALIKAENVFNKLKISCISDDSGLEIEFLQGYPGIYSSRYLKNKKTQDNIQKILFSLKNVLNRKARLICVFCLKTKKKITFFEGILYGNIAHEKKGIYGFDYDSIFIPKGHKKTLAQLSIEEKNKISHRYQAFKKLNNLIKI